MELIGSEVYDDFESVADTGVGVGNRLSHLDGRRRFLRVRRAHLDDERGRGVSARTSQVAGNAETSNQVGAELVWWAAGRYFAKLCGNLGNQTLSDHRAGGSSGLENHGGVSA